MNETFLIVASIVLIMFIVVPSLLACICFCFGMAKTLNVVKQDVTELKGTADDLDETTDNTV